MKNKPLLILLILFLLIGGFACGTKNKLGETVAPVFLVVNGIQPLHITPVYNLPKHFGDVNFYGEPIDEIVLVTLANEFKDPLSVIPTSYQDILVRSYRVSFVRTDGGIDVPDAFERPTSYRVPAGGTATIDKLVILKAHQKIQPPLEYLQPWSLGFEPTTNYFSITCKVLIEFNGETVTGEEVFASGYIMITFMDYADIE